MRIYIVIQFETDADGRTAERELYRGGDFSRAEFIRNNNRNAYIMVTNKRANKR